MTPMNNGNLVKRGFGEILKTFKIPNITALVTSGFRQASKRAAEWLKRESYKAAFVGLPNELDSFLKSYSQGSMSLNELWRSYQYLTGSQEPFINGLKYRLDPVLTLMPHIREDNPNVEFYCYQDLESHVQTNLLAEQMLLLEFKDRATSKIRVEEWRALLRKETENAVQAGEKSLENIAEKAREKPENVVVYGGHVRYLKQFLEEQGYKVTPVYLHKYWKSPLDALRTLVQIRGIDKVTDQEIEKAIRDHLAYMDYVLRSYNIDEAHQAWEKAVTPGISVA